MKQAGRAHWPLMAGILVFLAVVALLLREVLSRTQDQLVYALDDPYIHMAMAKNLARHGVWGLTRHGFTSSSSSLLWTLLLSGTYLLAGVGTLSPLLWNLAASIAMLVAVHRTLGASVSAPPWLFGALLALVFLVPLPVLVFVGQEHVLHALLTLLFVFSAGGELQQASPSPLASRSVVLCLLAPLLTLARYEGLFLVLVVCALFVLRGRWAYAVLLWGLALAPVGVYAIVSVRHGWLPLPNPVLMKGNITKVVLALLHGDLRGGALGSALAKVMGGAACKQFLEAPHVLFLTLAVLALLLLHARLAKGSWDRSRTMAVAFLGTTVLHLQFARTGWFYRYEAYLVALGLLVLFFLAADLWGRGKAARPAVGVLVLIPLVVLAQRSQESLRRVPVAAKNIYEQQVQMGRFLERYYQGEGVAANDVGAINFYADVQCLDLAGLGSIEVADLKRRMRYGPADRYDLAKRKNVRIAIVYDETFAEYGGLPPQWVKVGTWKISQNVVCGGDTISFYAADEEEKDPLAQHLRDFSRTLPTTVEQRGSYTRSPTASATAPHT